MTQLVPLRSESIGSDAAFQHRLRTAGLGRALCARLEATALEVTPGAPAELLKTRRGFEELARRCVASDAADLRLSYATVDALSRASERLGLARDGEEPHPFRRVWLQPEGSSRRRAGAIVRYRDEEVAVFLPSRRSLDLPLGNQLTMTYRGVTSSATFTLRLNDALRLPGAQVLHLTRPDGQGTLGRGSVRYDVHFGARVAPGGAGAEGFEDCTVRDISAGGLRLESAGAFEVGDLIQLELPLGDGVEAPLQLRAGVRWSGTGEGGLQAIAVRFRDLSHAGDMRLQAFLRTLEPDA